MKFQLFRFLVTKQEDALPFKTNRESFINSCFTKKHQFRHGKARIILTPVLYDKDKGVAIVSMWKVIKGYSEPNINSPGAYNFIHIIIDLSNDKQNGQIMHVEHNYSLFADNSALLKTFTKHINSQSINFKLEINPIQEKIGDFWTQIDNKKITKLELEYIPPNLFNHEDTIADEAKKAREIYNAETTKVILTNSDSGGLNIKKDDRLVNEVLDNVEHGSGAIRALSGRKTLYNSQADKNIKQIKLNLDISLNNIDWKNKAEVDNALQILDKLKELK